MRLWGAIPALAVIAGAVAISPAANAENLVEKIVDEFKHEVSDELRDAAATAAMRSGVRLQAHRHHLSGESQFR